MDQGIQRYFSKGASGLLVSSVWDDPRPVEGPPEMVPRRRTRRERLDGEVRSVDAAVLFVVGGLILFVALLAMAT